VQRQYGGIRVGDREVKGQRFNVVRRAGAQPNAQNLIAGGIWSVLHLPDPAE
jgi:hypothetical protein